MVALWIAMIPLIAMIPKAHYWLALPLTPFCTQQWHRHTASVAATPVPSDRTP